MLRERRIFQAMCASAMPLCGHNRDAAMMLGDSITFREHRFLHDLLLPDWKLVHDRLCSHRWLLLRLTWNSLSSLVRLQTQSKLPCPPPPVAGSPGGYHYAWLDTWLSGEIRTITSTALVELKPKYGYYGQNHTADIELSQLEILYKPLTLYSIFFFIKV